MNVQTLQYSESGGFSAPIGHQLDRERTPVLVFASPEFDQNLKPLEAIAAGYPRSVVVGCSTAGEIEAEQSMTVAGDLPQGSRARLMQANLDLWRTNRRGNRSRSGFIHTASCARKAVLRAASCTTRP
jgi:hypothetical protein